MNSEYEEAVYEFFTQEDNFKTIAEIADKAEAVSARIIKEFWLDLEVKLNEEINNWGDGWKCNLSSAFEKRYTGLQVYHDNWVNDSGQVFFSIRFEGLPKDYEAPYVGIWVFGDVKSHDSVGISEDVLSLANLKGYKSDSHKYWINWKHMPFKWDTYSEIAKILPETEARKTEIENAIAEVKMLKSAIEKEIDKILIKYKL